jgi:hypothetical protein
MTKICHSERSEESKKDVPHLTGVFPVFTGITEICHSERSEESKKDVLHLRRMCENRKGK